MSLERSSAGEAGINEEALLSLIDKLESNECHSVMIVRHGKVAVEGWWKPYRKDLVHVLYSLTKSFTSTAVGFAVQEKKLTVDDYVLSFFPDVLPSTPCEKMTKLRIKHLLSMNTGQLKSPEFGWDPKGLTDKERKLDEDHLRNCLSSYVEQEPGSLFVYNNAASFLLSAIITKVSGMGVKDYLQARLFEPLGIKDVYFESDSAGYDAGAFGMHLTTENIAKFGLFLLNRGKWGDKQLLFPEWIDEATSKHSDNSKADGSTNWKVGYGYQFWMCDRYGIYRADGAFGQLCIVMPKQEAVIVTTSGKSGEILIPIMEAVDELFPDSGSAAKNPDLSSKLSGMSLQMPHNKKNLGSAPTTSKLHSRLSELTLQLPKGDRLPRNAAAVSGKVYNMGSNALCYSNVSLTFGDKIVFHVEQNGHKVSALVGYNEWLETQSDEDPNGGGALYGNIACAGAFDGKQYVIHVVYNKTPCTDVFKVLMSEGSVVLDYQRSPTFGGDEYGKYHIVGSTLHA